MMCLDDGRLLELHTGDGTATDREHLDSCRLCASRMQVLRRDLARIDTVLATPPPRMVRVERRGWRWAPVALAAGLMLAVALHRGGAPLAPAHDDDTVTLADELVDAMTADVSFGDTASDPTMTRSTCTWGDPLLGVGCDEPAVTQIAWR